MSNIVELTPVSDRQRYERGDVLVKIEVDCRVVAQPMPGGYVATEGKQILKIRKSELASVMALVEPQPEQIEQAKMRFDAALRKHVEEGLAGMANAAPETTVARRRQLEAEFAGSVEAIFCRDMGRSILPLRSVTVLEENLPAPNDEAHVDQQTMLASIVAREVAKALGGMFGQQQLNQPPQQQQKKQ